MHPSNNVQTFLWKSERVPVPVRTYNEYEFPGTHICYLKSSPLLFSLCPVTWSSALLLGRSRPLKTRIVHSARTPCQKKTETVVRAPSTRMLSPVWLVLPLHCHCRRKKKRRQRKGSFAIHPERATTRSKANQPA